MLLTLWKKLDEVEVSKIPVVVYDINMVSQPEIATILLEKLS